MCCPFIGIVLTCEFALFTCMFVASLYCCATVLVSPPVGIASLTSVSDTCFNENQG